MVIHRPRTGFGVVPQIRARPTQSVYLNSASLVKAASPAPRPANGSLSPTPIAFIVTSRQGPSLW